MPHQSASRETFVHMAVHRPRTGMRDHVIASMHRMRAAILAQPGIIDCYTLEDEERGALIGIGIWRSKDDYTAARPAMMAAVEGDPFDEWEDAPLEIYRAGTAWTA